MLIAKKTLYLTTLPCGTKIYNDRRKEGGSFICCNSFWKLFTFSDPIPKTITVALHNRPAIDRVKITGNLDSRLAQISFDDISMGTFLNGREWILPFLKKYGTIYGEVWY